MTMEISHDHDYLFRLTDKAINAVLYALGTSRGQFTSASEVIAACNLTNVEPVLNFFKQADLLNDDYSFSEIGKELFEIIFIFSDDLSVNNRIAQILLQNPVINLILQSFYGRGKVGVEQLRTLLNYHNVGTCELVYNDVISLLTLLNKYGIAVYDKKNKLFYIKLAGDSVAPISQYYINPDTPYSNIYNMRKVIRSCCGKIYWIDKHFRKEGFEMLVDGLPYEGVESVTIISGTDNLTASAKADYTNLQAELSQRSIALNWRTINDSAFKWHDRWLVADNQCHNIPPVLAIVRGQRAEILLTKERLDVQPFIIESHPVI